MQLLMAIACAAVLIGLAFAAMCIGLMLRGRVLRGGCGSHAADDGTTIGCDACTKKQLNICKDEDTAGLAGPTIAATMGRYRERADD